VPTPTAEIARYRERERQERKAAEQAANDDERGIHIIRAERYADKAWSLSEAAEDLPHLVSGLWR